MPDANLRDVTVDPNPPAAPPAEPVNISAAPAADAAQAVTNKEALEIGQLLLQSGVTKDSVNELLSAPQALQTMRYLVQNNPQEFLNLIERTDSSAGEKFLETMADTYVKRYAPRDQAPSGKGKDVGSDVMAEVAQLREQVTGFMSAEQQRQQAIATAANKQRYEGHVDQLFNALPKEVHLTKAETKALKAQLSQELVEDQHAIQRISNGNFVDVPRKFQTILEGWGNDRKTAAADAKAQREGRLNNASAEFLGGPQAFQIDPKDADSWDATESGFAKALEQAGR